VRIRIIIIDIILLAALALCADYLHAASQQPGVVTQPGTEQLVVNVGKTLILDMPVNIQRVSIANPATAEAIPVSARSLMLNGKATGDTSLVIWLDDGARRLYELRVPPSTTRIEAALEQLQREFGPDVQLNTDATSVYITGTVKDLFEADRAVAIATPLGKVINLLRIQTPPQEQQVLLKVRFADVDRTKSLNAGINFFGAPHGYPFNIGTGSTPPSTVSGLPLPGSPTTFSLADSLNLLLFDPHANVGATLQALAAQNLLQILAEPNLLAMNGRQASFLAGGQFPFPTLQGGGGGVGQVTVSFKEFGIRLTFLPTITPRGTIRLHVSPEVSSLDYANSLIISGSTVPAIDTRKVETEVELQSGQSFGIAGLLNNQTTTALSKIPGLGDIPILGKLFQSKQVTKNNSELLVIVTAELVAPIPEGQPLPEIPRPDSFIKGPGVLTTPPRTPGTDQTGPGPLKPPRPEITYQEMQELQKTAPQTQGAEPTGTPVTPPVIYNPLNTLPLPSPTVSPNGGAN
jgi:pilus assembly protein CpaC